MKWPAHINQVVPGDNMESLKEIPDGVVHCVVTSPPYWGLRDYQTGKWEGGAADCDHKMNHGIQGKGGDRASRNHTGEGIYKSECGKCGAQRIDKQIGLEQTPEEYVARMVGLFREVRRVLRDDGSLWLNLGDSYNAAGRDGHGTRQGHKQGTNRASRDGADKERPNAPGLKPKDLIMIPARVALALQKDGWYLRSDIIWCLSGGTIVYAKTAKGITPCNLKDLARLKPNTVELWNGKQWTRLVGMSRSRRTGQEIELKLRSGEKIACTPTHRFPTERGTLQAKDIVIGDNLLQIRLPDEPKQPKNALDLDAAWFAGLYLAECSRSGRTLQIAGHAKEEDRWRRIQRVALKYGGSTTRTVSGNNMNIRVYGRVLRAIIDEFVSGRIAHNKGFSPVVWRRDNAFLQAMVESYLDGDAHWDALNNRWRLGFARNYNLARDLRTACARLGWKIRLRLATARYQDGIRPTFRGEIRKTLSDHGNERQSTEVVAIGSARCRELWDIGVEDKPHIFALASGILTHNSKPNPMPESVTDRPTKAHEYIFLLTKSERYYYDAEAIKEPVTESSLARVAQNEGNPILNADRERGSTQTPQTLDITKMVDPSGRNKRSVWTVTTMPYKEAHFATFPVKLIEPCILAGTSERGACSKCGTPLMRQIEPTTYKPEIVDSGIRNVDESRSDKTRKLSGAEYNKQGGKKTIGWSPGCKCAAVTRPCIVLDPFGGAGTTGLVAAKHSRDFVLLELNPEYCEIARKRIEPELRQGKLI